MILVMTSMVIDCCWGGEIGVGVCRSLGCWQCGLLIRRFSMVQGLVSVKFGCRGFRPIRGLLLMELWLGDGVVARMEGRTWGGCLCERR